LRTADAGGTPALQPAGRRRYNDNAGGTPALQPAGRRRYNDNAGETPALQPAGRPILLPFRLRHDAKLSIACACISGKGNGVRNAPRPWVLEGGVGVGERPRQ